MLHLFTGQEDFIDTSVRQNWGIVLWIMDNISVLWWKWALWFVLIPLKPSCFSLEHSLQQMQFSPVWWVSLLKNLQSPAVLENDVVTFRNVSICELFVKIACESLITTLIYWHEQKSGISPNISLKHVKSKFKVFSFQLLQFEYNEMFLLPVVKMPEQGSDGDMHRLLWTLRPHRLPFFCTAVSSGALASLLSWQQWRPRETNIRKKDSNCQRGVEKK